MSETYPRTRAELRAMGWSDSAISARLRRQHSWVAPHRGVVVPAGAPLDLKARARAACAAVGPDSVVRGLAAAVLWNFEGLPESVIERSPDIGLWVPPHVNAESRAGIVVRHTSLAEEDVTEVHGIRLTTPARTAADLARQDLRRDDAVVVVDAALRQKQFSIEDLDAVIARLRGQRGVVAVRQVRRLARTGTRSCGETRIRLRIVDAGFPVPTVGYEIREDSILLVEADLAYVLLLIWIEYDGFDEHTKRETFRRDRPRERFVKRRGWYVLRVTGWDVRHPQAFLADLAAAVDDAPRRIAALPRDRSAEVAAARAALGLD